MKKGDKVFGLSVFGKDITERKRAENELRQSEERFRQVAESVGDFIWEVDPNGLYRYTSPAVEKILGYAPDELIGKIHFYDLFAPEVREELKAAAFKAFAAQKSFRKLPNKNVSKDGKIVNLETSGVPVLDEAGKLVGYRGSDTDVTASQKADEAIKAKEAALRNSQKDIQKLAGKLISAQEEELRRLSRELHDDLTQRLAVLAIEAGKLELDLMRMPERCPKTVYTVAQIKNQLIKVSEDVHTISRQLHPTILDDLGLVRAIESECSAVMRRHPVEIVFTRENVPDTIPNDVGLCLYRVVQEGLRNIVAHSRAKNCEIFLKCDDHSICLTVSDVGIGFDPLQVRKMPGLGISSMRERVQLIQGDFSITSRPGKGTMISVCAPLTGGEI
jgi:PAS domain S-box-containing protein